MLVGPGDLENKFSKMLPCWGLFPGSVFSFVLSLGLKGSAFKKDWKRSQYYNINLLVLCNLYVRQEGSHCGLCFPGKLAVSLFNYFTTVAQFLP